MAPLPGAPRLPSIPARPVSVGEIVLYRVVQGRAAGQTRPAVVVIVHDEHRAALRIMSAGVRDSGSEYERGGFPDYLDSAERGNNTIPGTWWPKE